MSPNMYVCNKTIISVEGNIGAGKTTILDTIASKLQTEQPSRKIVIVREPVDEWSEIKDPITGETILQKFYSDVHRYSFAFQVMAFATRISAIKNAIRAHPECDVFLCERSLDADGFIFAKMMYDDGAIDPVSYQVYRKIYESTVDEFPLHKIMYLNISPELCSERILKRARNGEENISLDYLRRCYDYHESWIRNTNIPVVELKNDEHIAEFVDICLHHTELL